MPRRFAHFNIPIWQDEDWRALPREAQHLYLVLWTHPLLTYAGVLDWRPGRLAALAGGWTVEQVEEAAACLEARLFIVTDPGTEEVLIRSWFRFDGLMSHHRMCVSFANAFAAVASSDIRGVLVHEANKLRKIEPELVAWTKPQVLSILELPSLDPRDRELPKDPLTHGVTHSVTHGVRVGANPRGNPRAKGSPTPAPAPAPYSGSGGATRAGIVLPDDAPAAADAGRPKKTTRGTRIPEPFNVTPEMVTWARTECPGLDHRKVTEAFVDYWRGESGSRAVKLDWIATWRNWMRREHEQRAQPRRGGIDERPRPGTSGWDRRLPEVGRAPEASRP